MKKGWRKSLSDKGHEQSGWLQSLRTLREKKVEIKYMMLDWGLKNWFDIWSTCCGVCVGWVDVNRFYINRCKALYCKKLDS